MANLCTTVVSINATSDEDREGIKKLTELAEAFIEGNKQRWLGDFAAICGVATIKHTPNIELINKKAEDDRFKELFTTRGCFQLNGEPLSCRSDIDEFDTADDEQITFYVSDAWCPHLKAFKLIAEKFAPTAELIFSAEEPGCLLFVSNDPSYNDRYYFDNWNECEFDYESNFDMSEDELLNSLIPAVNRKFEKEFGGQKIKTYEDLVKFIEQTDQEFSIHKWEESSVENFCD